MSPRIHFVSDRTNKFHARPIVVDGERFDSTGEASRWGELRYLEKAGQIFALRRQVSFALHAGDRPDLKTVGTYVADFTYDEPFSVGQADSCRRVVEDFKGLDTPLSRWKRKHLELEYGLIVKVTHASR